MNDLLALARELKLWIVNALCSTTLNWRSLWRVRSAPHGAGEIWKRCVHPENASYAFRPHYSREISKRNYHRQKKTLCASLRVTVNDLIINKSSSSKTSSLKFNFVYTNERGAFSNFALWYGQDLNWELSRVSKLWNREDRKHISESKLLDAT